MKLLLVHPPGHALGPAWQREFAGCAEVEVRAGDICGTACDAVVSPANSFGFMDGGLDLALSERFGWALETRVQAAIRARPLGELLVGEALAVPTGDPRVPWLVVAPTMRVPMRLRQSVAPYLAMKALLVAARDPALEPPVDALAVPGLGTGVGGLPAAIAARQMRAAFDEIVFGRPGFPADFGEAQGRHIRLNPEQIDLWNA